MADIMKKIKEELTLENVLMAAMKTLGVKIRREVFLRKELGPVHAIDNKAKSGIIQTCRSHKNSMRR